MVAAGLGITTAPLSLAIPGTRTINVKGYDFRRTVGLLHDPAQRTGVEDIVRKVVQSAQDAGGH